MTSSAADRETQIKQLFEAGVNAVSGFEATRKALLHREFSSPIYLAAVGKAADSMASGAISVLGNTVVSGLVITKHHHLSDQLKADKRLECLESAHPVPDEASLLAGQRLIDFVSSVPEGNQLVFLVSGGASALVESLSDGLTLDDLQAETDRLLASGAAIGEMNKVRRMLSQIKGGKLARHVNCDVLQLLISDVPGDKLQDIGSGLLVPDAMTDMPETLSVWERIDTHIVASSSIAQQAVCDAARMLNLNIVQGSGSLHGDMPTVVQRLTEVVGKDDAMPGVYIWGGEPTVVLPENPGRGGRNQHLALSLARVLSEHPSASMLVAGTDGTDGPTNDAGGVITNETLAESIAAELAIDHYLENADAGTCLDALGALLTTGPTGTNVMDLAIAILE